MLVEIYLFLIGIVLGSFLNVCIHRLPKDESIVRPGSYCPKCKKSIAWFDNIPLLSFLILRGRCRHCGKKISWRYPLVELASGLIWFLGWRAWDGSPVFWIQTVFLTLLLIVSVTDLETGLIPDEITIFGIIAGLGASFLYPSFYGKLRGIDGLGAGGLGLLAGGGLIYVTGLAGNWIFQRESMGGGDVKLMAMIGAFLGWEKVLMTFFLAPFFALPFAFYRRLVKKEEIIPYGPFLALAGAVQFFYGETFWKYFLGI